MIRIFNMDEGGLELLKTLNQKLKTKTKNSLICELGENTYEESARSNKESITTIFAVNGSGTFASSFTIFKYVRLLNSIIIAAPSGWGIG